MMKLSTRFLCLFLLLFCLQLVQVSPVAASEKEERMELLQQKMAKLQELLSRMEEEKLREQPPTDIPWNPILAAGDERTGYYQYAYLLASQMRAIDLDSVLQQLSYVATQDEMKERGVLFVVPSLPLEADETMAVKKYNRDLAAKFLKMTGMPTAIEGGMLIAPFPLGHADVAKDSLLFIDLSGCDQRLRSQIFALLQNYRIFTDDGSVSGYVWKLLQDTAPQVFTIYMHGKVGWLKLEQ